MFEKISEYGKATVYDKSGLIEAQKTMMSFGIEGEKAFSTLKQIGDIAMGDSQKMQSLALAFSQATSAGKLQGQDLMNVMAVARTRTAKQYHDFTSDPISNELYPNIKWLPSRSASPREAHRVFWNRVWAKNDPFWNSNTPGSLWNCKCDWEETDEPVTDKNPNGTMSAKGLEGNPAVTGKVFTDDCPYVKCIRLNRKQREAVETKCNRLNQNTTISNNPSIKDTTCVINGKVHDVIFEPIGIEHYAQDCFGNKDLFWVKNEILPYIGDYISKAQCTAKKESDTTHNTSKKTLRLKKQTDYFYYFPIVLPNGKMQYCIWADITQIKLGKKVRCIFIL